MKKFYLLLMAVVFTLSANAGTKNLVKMDFESGDPASLGWASANLAAGMSITGDEYGNYFQFSLGGANGRSCYNTWGTDIYTDQLAEGTYHVEFEWAYATPANNQFGTELAIYNSAIDKAASSNATINANEATLFSVTESADNHELFFINGDAANTFAVSGGAWFKVLLDFDVTNRKMAWRIVDQLTGETEFASGTREFAEGTDMLAAGMKIYCARYTGTVQIDNLKVQVITTYDIANNPTVALTGVNNTERTYSIAFQEEEVLHVKGTDGTEIEVLYGDTEGGVYKYTTTTSGTLEAWTTSGTATSEKVSVAVECIVIQLPQATVAITNALVGFAKEYTITVSNEEVPTKPTLYVSYQYTDESGKVVAEAEEKFSGEKVSVDGKGTLTVTVVAQGFGPSTVSVKNDTEFEQKYLIDFQHMTIDELTAKGFVDKGALDAASGGGESTWTSGQRLYYRIATGEMDEDGNPTWTNYPMYGASEAGLTPIQRYKFLQSKLTQEVAHSIFAPLYTWYYNDGSIVKTSCDADGNPLTSDSEQPKNSGNVVHAIGGSVNLQVYIGIGFVFPGVQGDEENYDPAGAGYGNISVANAIFGVDGLTDNEFIIVSKAGGYGNTANHGDFPAGTDPEVAKAQWLQDDLGTVKEVYKGTETFQLYRIDTAMPRVTVLTPKNGTGIETLPYNKVVSDQNAPVYNLNGVQVEPNALQKGIYIKQGKKFVIK
ncbi:MAG: hypothetical protein II886_07490 [Prevotella sp.]|nr:hypothetical protein [Prevotella sp.]